MDRLTKWDLRDLACHDPDAMRLENGVAKWAEPDPTADASSDLSEDLYPPGNTDADFWRRLEIGEFLTGVVPCTDGQRMRCHELLSATAPRRLRPLIPWLRNRDWCGSKLLLLLEFRKYWELPRNNRWWETYHRRSGPEVGWVLYYNPTTLTWGHASELVEKRGHCEPDQVIDRRWFEDWDKSAAWTAGVKSFASFAVFRAGVPSGQDWRELLFPRDQRTPLEVAQCNDATFAPFMDPSLRHQYGCPQVLDRTTDLWPDLNDLAHKSAAALGGDLAQAWQETMAHFGRA